MHPDPMVRLRAANPVPGDPVPPALAELPSPAPAMEDVSLPASRRRRQPGRLVAPRRLAPLVAVATTLAVVGVVTIGQPAHHGVDVAAAMYKATAAPAAGQILHVVSEVSVQQDGRQVQSEHDEQWLDVANRRSKITQTGTNGTYEAVTAGGRDLAWNSKTGAVERGAASPGPPQLPTPVLRLRKLYADGKLRVAQRSTIDGRETWRLVSVAAEEGRTIEAVIDAQTYVPREITTTQAPTDAMTQSGGEDYVVHVVYSVYDNNATAPPDGFRLSHGQ
jgi:hypothetical protein